MPATTRWDAQRRLLTILQAAQAAEDSPLAPVTVQLGNPFPGVVETDVIWVSEEIDEWQGALALTSDAEILREETFSIRIHAYTKVRDDDDGALTAIDRLEEITTPVEDAIEGDPALGGLALLAQLARAQVEGGKAEEATREAMWTGWVNVRALAARSLG